MHKGWGWVLSACGLVACLTACGGGGDDGGSGAALTLSPSPLMANWESGTSSTLTVRVSVNNPSSINGDVYVFVDDSQQVLAGNVELSAIDSRTFSATLHGSATLAKGRHKGTLGIRLCRDIACTSQYPGSPMQLPYEFNVAAAPMQARALESPAATVHWGTPVSRTVNVSVTQTDLPWTATTQTGWLRVTSNAGTGTGTFGVRCDATGLAVGSYTGKVTVLASDGQSAEVPFSLEVIPTQFAFTSGVPSFHAVNGTTIAPQTQAFQLDSQAASPWTAVSRAAWMIASPLSGTTPASITLQPDPTRGPLASGTHAADIVLSSPGIASKAITAELTLIPPSLSAPVNSVTLGGPKGRDFTGPQALAVSLNTGGNSWPFSLSAAPPWASVGPLSGTVNGTGSTLKFTPQPAAITAGSVSSTVTMTARVNGDTVQFPVTVNLNADQRRLLASEWGVAMASTPTGSVLKHSVTLTYNFSGNTLGPWTWTSDSPWLTASSSAGAGASTLLNLTANPASLANGSLNYATVTVKSLTAGTEPAVIRVALYKDGTGLASTVKLAAANYTDLVPDRIRPHVYAHAGGTSIDVYHAYTAQKIATLQGVGTKLGRMSVSPDGSRLYAIDTAAQSVSVVDLSTKAVTSWPMGRDVSSETDVLAIRPNGVEVVLFGDGHAYAATGRKLGATGIVGKLTASSDGRKVYTSAVNAYDVDYSAMSGGVLMVNHRGSVWSGSDGAYQEVATNADGSRVYTAASSPYLCGAFDGSTLTPLGSLPGGDAYPNNIEVTQDGRAICGIFGWYSSADFWVHSQAGVVLKSFKFAGYARAMKHGGMAVTPDGLVVVALTDDPLMAFVPIGP